MRALFDVSLAFSFTQITPFSTPKSVYVSYRTYVYPLQIENINKCIAFAQQLGVCIEGIAAEGKRTGFSLRFVDISPLSYRYVSPLFATADASV